MADEKNFELISSSNITVNCTPSTVTLNIDDLAMYLEVTDLLRCFQNVAINRFLNADPGTGEGQREWLLNGLIEGVRVVNINILKTPVLGCAPHCGTEVCFECRPQIVGAGTGQTVSSASKKSGPKKAAKKKGTGR